MALLLSTTGSIISLKIASLVMRTFFKDKTTIFASFTNKYCKTLKIAFGRVYKDTHRTGRDPLGSSNDGKQHNNKQLVINHF